MKRIVFWFDPISPYACLAFEHLPQALAGLSYAVEYRPVLFAGLLKAYQHKGPAEIPPKRDWTFRDVAWQARALDVPLRTPAQHPFNPLPLLRLMLACAPLPGGGVGTPNRRVVETVMRHVWRDGDHPLDPQRLAALRAALQPALEPDSDAVRTALRAAGDEALAAGVFGVPTVQVDQRLFWGVSALPMVAACLRGDDTFFAPGGPWDEAGVAPPGVVRANPG